MSGKNVGMIWKRIYEANIIAANGGKNIPATKCKEEVISIFRMLEQLKNGEIDGFLLDKYTYWEWITMMDNPENYDYDQKAENASTCREVRDMLSSTQKHPNFLCPPLKFKQCRNSLVKYFKRRTTQHNIPHTGDEAGYGIWIKDRNHYNFFRNAFENNRLTFKSDLASDFTHPVDENKGNDFLYTDLDHYEYLYIVLGGLLIFIVLFGVGYETLRRKRERKFNVGIYEGGVELKNAL